MKIFLVALSGLLLFDSSQGSALPQGRPIRALNTTLRTNFSGIYQRKNPCSGSEVETSLYKASHELHHHTKDDSWSGYTHKCSAIIRNFLQTIGNLIKFNNDPSGSFNFYLNTSISQKQRLTGDPNSCESLPTIVIEATDCKIPLSSSSQISKGESFKCKDAEGQKYDAGQFLGEEILPLADFSGQEDCKDRNAVPVSDAQEVINSLQSTTQNPRSDWFEAEESSSKDDNLKFPTTFSPSAAEDISQAVLYDLSRGTQSAYEPKPKFFKTSLKLTPQTDPENGTIQPQIHYMAADLLADPSRNGLPPQFVSESSGPLEPQSAYEPKPKFFKTSVKLTPQTDPENGAIQPQIHYMAADLLADPSRNGLPPQFVSESSGPLEPIPFPEGPSYATIAPSPPSERPPQVPPPFDPSAFESSANQNEPVQRSDTVRPSSLTGALAEPTVAPIGKPFFSTPDLPPPVQFSDNPSEVVPPEDQNAVNRINDPRFSFVPFQSQPAMSVKYDADTLNVQTSTFPPQLFDISSKSTSQNSSPHPTTYSEPQAQPNLLPPLRQTPQEDLRIQVSQPPVNFPGQPSEANGEHLNYSAKLNRPPTVDDLLVESGRGTLIPNFGNQLGPPVPTNGAQSMSPLYQQFPGQLPQDSRLLSTDLIPGVRPYERGSLTTPLPPLQYESREGPYYSEVVPAENKEVSNDRSTAFASQPPVNPQVVSNLPYSDSLVASTPRQDGLTVSAHSPVNSETYLGQQPTSDDESTKRLHTSSVTTVEETMTYNDKQTTPGFVLEQIPGSTANNFNPSSPSGSNFASYNVPQQFPSVLPDNPQPQSAGTGLLTTTNPVDDSRLLINPENALTSMPTPNNAEFSQISDTTLSPNDEPVLRMPVTSQNVPLPFQQESQLVEPEYEPSDDGLYMTTPMPYAPVPNSGKTPPNSPIAPEGRPSSTSTSSSSSTTITDYQDEYNFRNPSQGPLPANQPLVVYSDRIGNRLPPGSDSFVRGDYLTAAGPQPFPGNVDGFVPSTPDNGLFYGPASVSQFTDSQQQNSLPLNFEKKPSDRGSYQDWSGPQITEGVSSSLPSSLTPRPEEYSLQQEQQPVASTSSKRFQEEQFTTETMSSESAVTESPQAVFSQEQLEKDQNWRTNPGDFYDAMEQNLQMPSQFTTPVYSSQLPIEADTKQIFESQIENEFGEQSPEASFDSMKKLSDSRQTTDLDASLQPFSPDNSGPTDQYPTPFPQPNISGQLDAPRQPFSPDNSGPSDQYPTTFPSPNAFSGQSNAPLRPFSRDNSGPTGQYPTTFPQPNTFSGQLDAPLRPFSGDNSGPTDQYPTPLPQPNTFSGQLDAPLRPFSPDNSGPTDQYPTPLPQPNTFSGQLDAPLRPFSGDNSGPIDQYPTPLPQPNTFPGQFDAPLRPLSPDNIGPSDQYPTTSPQPNTFPGQFDATAPASFPPATVQPNEEFAFNKPSSLADSFATEMAAGKPDFQESSPDSEQFSNFNSESLSPGVAVDTSKPQITTVPLAGSPSSPFWDDNFDQTAPVSSLLSDSSTKDLSADSLPTAPVDAYAFSTPQDAGTTLNADSPAKYPIQPLERPQFFTSTRPQPTFPIQKFDKSTQTTPPQPFNSVPPVSIASQPQDSDLIIQTPLETPELSFNQPFLLETNTVQPPTTLPVGPVAEIFPTPPYPGQPGLQYVEEGTTPQVFEGSSSESQTYVNGDSHPQDVFSPQSAEGATSLQETELLSSREESRASDFGQNPNYEPVAEGESFVVDSTSLPQRVSQRTTSFQETTTTDTFNSDGFSAQSAQAPFLEPLQKLPESTAAGEIITAQQQSFPSPGSYPPLNYADQSSDEFTNSFNPLVSQEISKPNVQISANADSSSAILRQQPQTLDLRLPSTVPTPVVTPESPLTYPDQPTSHDSLEVVNSVVSDSVESLSSQQEPQNAGAAPPLNAELQTLSQVSSNFQERDERLSETSTVNVQPYGAYNQLRPVSHQQNLNYYNGNFPTPPRVPLPGRYPAPNYVQNPLLFPENQPPFYGPQSMPQNPNPQPSSQKSEITVQQVTESETTSLSTGPQTQPRPVQPDATFSPEGQLATSDERVSANVPVSSPQGPANPNGFMPPRITNYNALRSEDRYRYFGHPPRSPYPLNYDPQLGLPNQQNLPPYYNLPNSYPDQRPVPPPMNQIMDGRQIIRTQPGREMGVPSDGRTIQQQTQEIMDYHPGVPIREETGSRPFEEQPPPEDQLRNPLLQALQSQLVAPMQEQQDQHTSFPGRSDQNERLSLDRMSGSQIYNAPAGPWKPGPATNFVNLQQNTALDAPLGALQPRPHALVPDQTTPSNEPDPASTGRSDYMASPLRKSFYADRMRSGSGPERF